MKVKIRMRGKIKNFLARLQALDVRSILLILWILLQLNVDLGWVSHPQNRIDRIQFPYLERCAFVGRECWRGLAGFAGEGANGSQSFGSAVPVHKLGVLPDEFEFGGIQ
jgi:hypothetical protein